MVFDKNPEVENAPSIPNRSRKINEATTSYKRAVVENC